MIPNAYLQEWSAHAPWPDPRQIEQDLIICRALCDLFNEPTFVGTVAFRGGTAINKLLFARPLRYSEDIDLVQIKAGPIGETIDAIRSALLWLGNCKRSQARHSTHLTFQFTPEADAAAKLKLKVEINTREHTPLHGIKTSALNLPIVEMTHDVTASVCNHEEAVPQTSGDPVALDHSTSIPATNTRSEPETWEIGRSM